MMSHRATMAVAVLFGEKESTEQVNCVVSSMHRACPAYPQLLTYRCGAANRRFGPIACRLPWWNARERCDKALMVPNLYVETTCHLRCLLHSLFVVGALHNFGAPQKVTTPSDGVDAI
jgi:hypothetical protein